MTISWIEALKGEGYTLTQGAHGFYGWAFNGHQDGDRWMTEGDAWQDARHHRNWSVNVGCVGTHAPI
ncbi:MAG: hypothetical protein ACHP7P_14995 [Terriglobales bacterium]